MKSLKILDLSHNHISDLSFIKKLTNIHTLSLGNNEISDVSYLKELENLTSLELSNNKISDISFIQSLHQLDAIYLNKNQILDYSPLTKMEKLRVLDISQNNIQDISFLKDLKKLKILDMTGNYISDLSSIKELEIEHLQLIGCDINDISPLGELKNLKLLDLRDAQIVDMFPLGKLKNIQTLNISRSQTPNISFLSQLNTLQTLDISGNKISDITPLEGLIELRTLSIHHNKVTDIAALKNLSLLTTLDISYNYIASISCVENFRKLESFHMIMNYIQDISYIENLNSLKYVSIAYNLVSNISHIRSLNKLDSFDMTRNLVVDISVITNLDKIKNLGLSYNLISNVLHLKKILRKNNLASLSLYNNPISYLPQVLLGTDEKENCLPHLRNYYQNQDFVPNKEIKVVILGNGMVGKSTLLNRFLNPTGDWETKIKIDVSKRTDGIVIKENIPFDLEDDKEIRLNIWDFGGQEVYHGTHRFFLNKDAVYIIVWTLETDEQKEEIRQDLNYWLDYAQDLAIDSPIILVHSQCDKESEKDQDKIDEQVDILRDSKYKNSITTRYLPFSAKEKTGIKELNEAIKKAIKDKLSARVETEIPKKWSDLRDDLRKLRENEEDKQNEISKEDYLKECANYEIKESEAETVLTFLHRTGFLYYDEKLSKNIILNQTWAIEAIYEALKPKSIAKTSKGKLEYEDLESFWLEKGYSEEEAKTFIDFMVSSEICFCKEQQNYRELENPTFIVPHYLEEPANSFTRWRYENSFYMIYKPQFFHKGIAERFLSRLGRLSKETDLWRDGIRIFSDTFKGEALIIFDREKKEVNISTENYELLKAILNELNKILDKGSQTKPSEKVTFFYSLDGEEFVEKKHLLEGKELNSDFVFTTEKKKVDLKPLLEKYRFDSTQKTSSKEFNFEIEEKQNETSLMKEANNKVIPIEETEQNSNSQTTNQNTYFMPIKDDEQHKGIHFTVNVDAGIKDSFKDFGKSQQSQNQSQQIDFKAFENSLIDLQRNLGYVKQEIEGKINKESKNTELIEAKEIIQKTIDAAEKIEEDAEKAVEGDKKAEKNIKKDKFGFFRAVKTCASYIPKIAEKASNPKTWEDAQKSLEEATKFGEQLGNMM